MATRLLVAQGLAATGFCAILAHAAISALWPVGAHTRGMVLAPTGAFASIAVFAVSHNRRTALVPALLVATGLVGIIDAMADPAALVPVFPGPILGLFFGIVALALGVTKAATARTKKMPASEMQKGGWR